MRSRLYRTPTQKPKRIDMKKTILLLCCTLILGCSLPFFQPNPTIKECVEGIVLNHDGTPMPNTNVDLYAVGYNEKYLLNSIKSDDFGRFEMCFSATSNIYGISINRGHILFDLIEQDHLKQDQVEELGSKVFYFHENDFENQTFTLEGDSINIPMPAFLNLTIKAGFDFVSLKIEYDGDTNRHLFENEYNSSLFRVGQTRLRLVRGSSLVLTYTDSITGEDQSFSVLMDSEEVDFEIQL